MELTATSFCLLLFIVNLVWGQLLPHEHRGTRGPKKWHREEERSGRVRQPRLISNQTRKVKVIDVSADNDQVADSNGEYTSATMLGGSLPHSFTICSAYMVEAWNTEQSAADLFSMLDDDGQNWVYLYVVAAEDFTSWTLNFGPIYAVVETKALLFPLLWTRVCISHNSVATLVTLVVDGQMLVEEEYKMEEDEHWPANVSLRTGFYSDKLVALKEEYTGRYANLNVFKTSLSVDRMIRLTMAGEEECGTPGDLVSWEEAEWTLHSQAKTVEVDRDWEGPCRKESKVQIFIADFTWVHDCMFHCPHPILNFRNKNALLKSHFPASCHNMCFGDAEFVLPFLALVPILGNISGVMLSHLQALRAC